MHKWGTIPAGFGLNEILDLHESFHFVDKIQVPGLTKPDAYVHYKCSCPEFWHRLRCKHALATGIGNGDFAIPKDNDCKIMGFEKRTSGRPNKLPSALIRMD